MNINDMLTAASTADADLSTLSAEDRQAVEAIRNSPFFTLVPSFLERTVKVAELDGRMATKAGTFSQRKAEKLALVKADVENPIVVELTAVEAELAAVKERHELAVQAVEDAIVELLKADKADVTTELTALQAERTELVTQATSMATLITGASKPVTATDIGIGKAKGSGSGSSGSGAAKVKSGEHYRLLADGTPKAYANSTFSGLAFYAFRKDGTSPSADELTAALTAAGITELTKPWQAEITLNGVTRTVGHTVLDPAAPVEAPPAE